MEELKINEEIESKVDVIEEKIDGEETNNIKEFFITEPASEGIKEISSIFKESEEELIKEYSFFKANKLFSKMDYFLVDLSLNSQDFKGKCLLSERYNFKSITVYPSFTQRAKSILKGKSVKVRSVIGYPFGEDFYMAKFSSLKKALKSGADEIAYTISVSQIKGGEYSKIIKELKRALKLCKKRKFYPVINPQDLTIIEVERCLKIVSSLVNVSSIIILPQDENYKINLDTIGGFISLLQDNSSLEIGGSILKLADVVSLLLKGTTSISSPFSPKIAEELKEKINLNN